MYICIFNNVARDIIDNYIANGARIKIEYDQECSG